MRITKGRMFAGLTVAIVTPFRNGLVDYPALCRSVDWHIAQGTNCLAPVGTTGESPTVDHEEHEKIIETVVQQAAGRIKVMPGTGSNSTKEAIRLTKFAKKPGRTGHLLLAPITTNPPKRGTTCISKPSPKKRAFPLSFTTYPEERPRISSLKPLPRWRKSPKLWRSRRRQDPSIKPAKLLHFVTSLSFRVTTA